MKAKTKELVKFLKKVQLSDTQLIKEGLLKFEEDGLKIDANSPVQESRVMGWLKKSVFDSYEAIGTIGINELQQFIKVLERFDDVVTLKKDGNLLNIKGGTKKVDVELVAENFLATDTGAPKLEFDETFQITSTKLKDVFKDVKMNDDVLMTFETEEGTLKVSNTGKYKFQNKFKCPTLKGGTKVEMGNPLIDATNGLDEILDISVKSSYPMKIQEKTDNSVITIIIAPRMDEDK